MQVVFHCLHVQLFMPIYKQFVLTLCAGDYHICLKKAERAEDTSDLETADSDTEKLRSRMKRYFKYYLKLVTVLTVSVMQLGMFFFES